MYSPVEEIKNKLDVVEVVGSYIKLTKAGRNYKANCPFHSEKTPSFFVSPERQMWHCFGCAKGGDIFAFVQEMEGLDFSEALKILAQKAGVIVRHQNPQLKTEKQRLFEICELAAKFFEAQLDKSSAGKKIQQYLKKRGLKLETIKTWRLGWAPDSWRGLSDFLKKRGYKDDEIIKAGLSVQKEKSPSFQFYDRFRNRIIFPIFDLNSQVIGFGARENPEQPDSQMGKYINSPGTFIYDKSRVLYGLDKAKAEIRIENCCLIVEGYMDVLMSWQAGAKNVAASSGTALTQEHLKLIKRYTENLALSFDMDIAGDAATKRAIDLAIEQGFNVKIIQIPQAKDPADLIKENPSQWSKEIAKSQPVIDFYFSSAFAKFNPAKVDEKKQIAKILLTVLKKIPNKVEQAHWLQELSRRLKIDEKTLAEEMKRILTEKSNYGAPGTMPKATAKPNKSRRENLEEEFLALLLMCSERKKYLSEFKISLFSSPILLKIFEDFKDVCLKKSFVLEKWQAALPEELRSVLNQILLRLEIRQPDEKERQENLTSCLKELKKENLKQKMARLQMQITSAEAMKDKKKLQLLLEKLKKTSKDKAALE